MRDRHCRSAKCKIHRTIPIMWKKYLLHSFYKVKVLLNILVPCKHDLICYKSFLFSFTKYASASILPFPVIFMEIQIDYLTNNSTFRKKCNSQTRAKIFKTRAKKIYIKEKQI